MNNGLVSCIGDMPGGEENNISLLFVPHMSRLNVGRGDVVYVEIKFNLRKIQDIFFFSFSCFNSEWNEIKFTCKLTLFFYGHLSWDSTLKWFVFSLVCFDFPTLVTLSHFWCYHLIVTVRNFNKIVSTKSSGIYTATFFHFQTLGKATKNFCHVYFTYLHLH